MMNNTELFRNCLKAAQQNLPEEHTTAPLFKKKNRSLIIFRTSIIDYNKGHDGMFMLNNYNEKTNYDAGTRPQ